MDNLASLYNSKQSLPKHLIELEKLPNSNSLKSGLIDSVLKQKIENLPKEKIEENSKPGNNETDLNIGNSSRIEMLQNSSRPLTPIKNN